MSTGSSSAGASQRFLSMTPLHHGTGLAHPPAALLDHGCVTLLERFDAEQGMRLIGGGGGGGA